MGCWRLAFFALLREKKKDALKNFLPARIKRPVAVELLARRSTAEGIWGVDASKVHTVGGSEMGGVGVRQQHTNCLYFMFMTHFENEMRAWYVAAAIMVRLLFSFFFYQENKALWKCFSFIYFGKLFFLPAEVFTLCGATDRTGKGAMTVCSVAVIKKNKKKICAIISGMTDVEYRWKLSHCSSKHTPLQTRQSRDHADCAGNVN